MGLALVRIPMFSASSSINIKTITTRRRHSNNSNKRRHPHSPPVFSTLASSQLPLSLFFRESTSSNQCRPRRSYMKYMTCKVSRNQVEVEDDMDDEGCELVSGVELSIGEGDDSIQAYLLKAVKNNNGTGILLLSDVFGFEDSSTRDFAYRVACNGYNVLVPDLFRGDPWAKNRPEALFENWLVEQTPERIAKDIATSTKWMMDEFVSAGVSKRLGIIGFCFGGGRVIDVLAQDQAACFGIGVSCYGTRIDPSVAGNVKVPVLLVAGDNDPLCPVSVLEDISKGIGKECKMVIFRGRGHAFAHRPQSLEEDRDAEEAFMIIRNWMHEGLVVGT